MRRNASGASPPMALHYANNGSGRDGYIMANNGGFSEMHRGSYYPPGGYFGGDK